MDYFRSKRFLETLGDWELGAAAPGPLSHFLPRMRALLGRLDDPQDRFPTVIVGGTNGKGSTASLLAALLRAAGCEVGLYTSPHLHTIRERVQVNGAVLDKEEWTDAVSTLYDLTRRFEQEGFGPFTRFEALTGLAALMFARAKVDYAVFEVGLGGRYDATNAWDSSAAILTSIQLDHVEVLGDTLSQIAEDKSHIARAGHPLFTPATQHPEVGELLADTCRKRGIPVCWVAPEDAVQHDVPGLPPDPMPGRPESYLENAGLAVAAASHLLGDNLAKSVVHNVIQEHAWPGRFEVASRDPWLVLDGAHNPAAAEGLAEDLGRIAGRWRFVVGGSRGHDATGLLRALAPIAESVILTRSTHPRSMSVDELRECVPSCLAGRCQVQPGLSTDALSSETPLCVTGSLYLVARARELLNLPLERDTFTEDLHRESLLCLDQACGQLGLSVVPVSENGNVVRLEPADRPVYFMRNKHPFNDYVTARLAEDKAYQHELFTRAGLLVPDTFQVFNPLADARFDEYKTHRDIDDVVSDVEGRFGYPVVVKRNQGSLAQGVFLSIGQADLRHRLTGLFEGSGFFDNVLLIQAFVRGPEFRAVATRQELLLGYEKVGEADSVDDLNPLHQMGSEAIKVTDTELLSQFAAISEAIADVLDLGFYAVDLIRNDRGLHILEVNPNPICYFYNQCNGRDDFVSIYRRLLEKYVTG